MLCQSDWSVASPYQIILLLVSVKNGFIAHLQFLLSFLVLFQQFRKGFEKYFNPNSNLGQLCKTKNLSLQIIIDCIFKAKIKQNNKTFFLLAELVNKVCCILLWQINGIQCVRKTLTSRIESVSKNLLGNLRRECLFFVFWLNWLFCDFC